MPGPSGTEAGSESSVVGLREFESVGNQACLFEAAHRTDAPSACVCRSSGRYVVAVHVLRRQDGTSAQSPSLSLATAFPT